MQNIITEDDNTAKRCIRHLKEQRSGRATFLPLTSVRGNVLSDNRLYSEDGFVSLGNELVFCDEKYKGIINSLLGRTAVADTMYAFLHRRPVCGLASSVFQKNRRTTHLQNVATAPPLPESRQFRHQRPHTASSGSNSRIKNCDAILDHRHNSGRSDLRNIKNQINSISSDKI